MKMVKTQMRYFENLDGLRFLCFLAVFTVHSLHVDLESLQDNFYYIFIVKGLLSNGGLGVNFFFVLSGFLITSLLILEKKATGKINVFNFWIKRILRIWPLYFACIFFGFVIFPYVKALFGDATNETADPRLYLIFLGNFDIIKNGWPDSTELGVLWSISIEEQFYLIWPLLFIVFPLRKLWLLFIGVVLCSLIFRAFNDDKIIYYYHTLSCISDMAVGGFGAWVINDIRVRKAIIRLSRPKIFAIYFLFSMSFFFKDQIFNHFYFTRIFERLLISILIILIILEQNYSRSSFYKMGNFKTISKLGLTTYGMYMLHVIAIIIMATLARVFNFSDIAFVIVILCPILSLMLTIVMSKISFNYFEKRFIALRKYLR